MTNISRQAAVSALTWHLNNSERLTFDQFNAQFPGIDSDDMKIVDRYLYVDEKETVRVRSRSQLLDWHQRYSDQRKMNWAALGVSA